MRNYIGVRNRIVDSASMLTWCQGNFTGILNKLSSSEAMPGERRGEEHTLDSAF